MKKWYAALVAGLLCLTMAGLAGCSGGDASSGAPTSGTSGTADPDGGSFRETVRDLGKKTIRLGSFWGDWSGGDSVSPEQQACAKALADIERDYNCTIELVSLDGETYAQDINTAIASGVVYANILEMQAEHLDLAGGGNLKDVSAISALGLDTQPWDKDAALMATVGKTQYGVGFTMPQQQSTNRNVLVFNKLLVSQYGLPDLYDLVRKGEWTFEKFTQISEDVVAKSGGSVLGMIDQYGQGCHFVYANGAGPVKQEGGRYLFNGHDERVLSALQFLQDYNKKGLYNLKDYVGKDFGLTESNVFMARKTLFFNADYWTVPQIFSSGMPDDYGVLPFPKGPDAAGYATMVTNARVFGFIEGDPDVEDAAAVMTAIAARCHLTDDEWIQKQAETALRDDESIEMLEIILESPTAVTAIHGHMGLEYIVATNDVIYDMSKTPKQAMDGIAQVCQANLDEYYKQK